MGGWKLLGVVVDSAVTQRWLAAEIARSGGYPQGIPGLPRDGVWALVSISSHTESLVALSTGDVGLWEGLESERARM